MRYIGGKTLLLDKIVETIPEDAKSVIDIFAGSGVVSNILKEKGYEVYSNDFLFFSYIFLRGITQINKKPKFENLGFDPIKYLNELTLEKSGIALSDCFIYQNYSPNENCERMYFQNSNAIKIDIIRITIENWKNEKKINDDEYYYLLAALIQAVPYVANITGVYAAYLKFWDQRTYKTLSLEEPDLIFSRRKQHSYNSKDVDLLPHIQADVLYADPPYNSREYLPNYHILETIAKYDYPEIKGKTGMRNYEKQKSDFCSKAKVKDAFENLIKSARTKYIIISYNNEGLLSTEELSRICKKYAVDNTFKLEEIDYRRYKSKIPNNEKGLREQIYFFEKKQFDKSPMNYIGGKYKLLNQLMPLFPNNINTFVDLFCGGCDVCSNVIANKTIANDINNYVIDIFKEFQKYSIEDLLSYIDKTIKKWHLSKENEQAYLKFREYYNKTRKPLDLYVLMNYSFNYQIRFNSKHEYNNPFGKNRSSFNDTIRENLVKFHANIKGINFTSENFKHMDLSELGQNDFVYCDPPYRITTGSYNDGKRGFEGWSIQDDLDLFKLLDDLNKQNVKFALSNVIVNKGKENKELKDWAVKYKVHYLDFDYSNSNYQSKNRDKDTVEVLITNY